VDFDPDRWWQEVPPQTLQVALSLAQSVWWVDSEATPHLVDAMTDRHRHAVLEYLAARSASLMLDTQDTLTGSSPGSAPHRAAVALLRGDVALADHSAWLESTPLIKRLRQLVR
jgi:hypothetical protein